MEEPAAGGLPQWTGVYAAFDDVVLTALANRGLVRRGRAEVAAGRVRPVRIDDDAIFYIKKQAVILKFCFCIFRYTKMQLLYSYSIFSLCGAINFCYTFPLFLL